MNTKTVQEAKKVYYVVDNDMQEKADSFHTSNRKKYVTKENNPFGYKEGIFFTGAGVRAGLSKTRTNFMVLYGNGKYDAEWNQMYDYIKTVTNAVAFNTIVSAKGHMKGSQICETEYDVETNSMGFHDFFYDKDNGKIYRYEMI